MGELKLLPCPLCGEIPLVNPVTGHILCCKIVADDIYAWSALPRALTWTTEPPKVAGWYWCRMSRLNMPRCVEVYGSEDGLRFGSGESWREPSTSVEDPDFQWAGPIPEPKEPT